MSFDRRRALGASGRIRWFTLAALAVVVVAVLFDYQWIWGLIFLIWSAPSLVTGVAFLVEPIHRAENPWLFWIITILWLGLSLALIGMDLARLFD